jgi:hypothetical protein
MQKVPLAANRFLEMMSETAVGWLLLEGAFANTVLPEVIAKSKILSSGDKSPMEIPTEAFATV